MFIPPITRAGAATSGVLACSRIVGVQASTELLFLRGPLAGACHPSPVRSRTRDHGDGLEAPLLCELGRTRSPAEYRGYPLGAEARAAKCPTQAGDQIGRESTALSEPSRELRTPVAPPPLAQCVSTISVNLILAFTPNMGFM